jgi:hypothetical protein
MVHTSAVDEQRQASTWLVRAAARGGENGLTVDV